MAPGVATATLAPATAALLLDVALRHVDRPLVEAEIVFLTFVYFLNTAQWALGWGASATKPGKLMRD